MLFSFRTVGGDPSFGPYIQSQRYEFYLAAWQALYDGGFIYPRYLINQTLSNKNSIQILLN